MRYRRHIGAEQLLILADIKKKHSSHALTADVDIVETAHAAEFFLSDGVIVTGIATGTEADIAEVQQVKAAVDIPVLIGSGVTVENVDRYLNVADALIIGSHFKYEGHWAETVEIDRVRTFMDKVNKLR
jgi:predicted TIM-barrel enzyme